MQHIAIQDEPLSMVSNLFQRARAWVGGRAGAVQRMRHVETLTLGPKRSLYLVECDGRQFLVAAGGDSVSAPVAVDAVRQRDAL